MEILWFCIISFMLAMYVVLDGFDLGVGILHFFIGKNEAERTTLMRSIGPVWDGNEVWLLAAGGTLYFAFPKLYASGFSGFYLPLTIALWLLIFRGIGIEFRHQIHGRKWKLFWDILFSSASILLSVIFGAALGNVIRGVPLNQDGYFFEPLWTTFAPGPDAGVLDWFTIIIGLVALSVLASHGSNYIAMKTEGVLRTRARKAAKTSWWLILVFSAAAIAATAAVRQDAWKNYADFPSGFIFPAVSLFALIGMYLFVSRGKDTHAFFSSSLFIAGALCATAFGQFPDLLPASTDPGLSITVYNAAAHDYGLRVGLVWWIFGIILTSVYFVYLYRSFRGKLTVSSDGTGY